MDNIKEEFDKLFLNISRENYYGYDPHDGLLSPVAQFPFINRSKWMKLFLLQFHKRLPFNVRPLFGIKKHLNPKALALVVSSLIRLKSNNHQEIKRLLKILQELKSDQFEEFCWGYPFDWQARAFFQKKDYPTVVASSFVAHAFLDAYEVFKSQRYLDIAESVCHFFLNNLNRTKLESGYAFSYSPADKSVVFNATALGASVLARTYQHTNEAHYAENAEYAIQPLISNQESDGSWRYGLQKHHWWIDNFHTAYNLECLYRVKHSLETKRYDTVIDKGNHFYLNNFFESNGFPKYYSHQEYPADTHAPAQLFSYLFISGQYHANQELADNVKDWMMKNLFNKRTGLFYYQKNKYFTNKINYLRWSQAWGLYGLASYIGMNK